MTYARYLEKLGCIVKDSKFLPKVAKDLNRYRETVKKLHSELDKPAFLQLLYQVNQRLNNYSSKQERHKRAIQEFASSLARIKQNITGEGAVKDIKAAIVQYDASLVVDNHEKRVKRRADKRNLADLRETAAHLQLLGNLKISEDMSDRELDRLAQENPDHFAFSCFKLMDRYELHRACLVCKPPTEAEKAMHQCLTDYTADKLETGPAKNYSKHSSAVPPVPYLFPSGCVEWTDVDAHHFTLITSGTTCGTVEIPDGNLEIGLVVHVLPFGEMKGELLNQFEMLAYIFHLTSRFGNDSTSNGAYKAGDFTGSMKVVGHTAGFFKGIAHHLYVPRKQLRNGQEFPKWMEFQHMQGFVRDFFYFLFDGTAHSVAAQTHANIISANTPILGHLEKDVNEHVHPGLGANLTVSEMLANAMHVDNDGLNYAFSLYLFVDNDGNLITDRELIMSSMEGGYFIWPDLHLGIDPRKCNGIVLFLWRGIYERHGTVTQRKISDTVTRYGCSIQVNKRLIGTIRNKTDAEGIFRGKVNSFFDHIEKYAPKE
ncbi:hypothetical protein BDV93DRAFT_523360 [Ceratobasidium sp. AG-I]|nr:hypothetical protein BDV93DRAFT_523360 [Ceratobasidium sp. AG-I]